MSDRDQVTDRPTAPPSKGPADHPPSTKAGGARVGFVASLLVAAITGFAVILLLGEFGPLAAFFFSAALMTLSAVSAQRAGWESAKRLVTDVSIIGGVFALSAGAATFLDRPEIQLVMLN